jgi:hypothetical protein
MSVVGGLLPIPFYVIISFAMGDNLDGFLGIGNANINFIDTFFNGSYYNIVLVSIIGILYTIKPIATTSFVLSSPSILSYLTVEILSKLFFIFVTLIFID